MLVYAIVIFAIFVLWVWYGWGILTPLNVTASRNDRCSISNEGVQVFGHFPPRAAVSIQTRKPEPADYNGNTRATAVQRLLIAMATIHEARRGDVRVRRMRVGENDGISDV